MDAHRGAFGRPFGRGANACAVEGNGQALEAAPRCTDSEQAELVEKGVHRRVWNGFEDDAEEPAGAGKIALPKRMARTALERGVKHAGDLGALLQPARHLQSGLVMLRQPYPHGAQAPQTQIDVVRTDAKPQEMHRVAQTVPCRLV